MQAQRAATIVAIGVVLPAAPRAVSDTDPIDAYIAAEMAARRIPGLALAVARDGAGRRWSTMSVLSCLHAGRALRHS